MEREKKSLPAHLPPVAGTAMLAFLDEFLTRYDQADDPLVKRARRLRTALAVAVLQASPP